MSKSSLLLSAAAALGSPALAHSHSHGDRACGFKDRTVAEVAAETRATEEALQRRYGGARGAGGNVVASTGGTINVYFHEIRNSDGDGAVTDTMIQDQIDVLNDAYADGGWSFELKDRDLSISDDWFNLTGAEGDYQKALRKGSGADLNFYTGDTGSSLVGWATLPNGYDQFTGFLDGVVCHFGTLPGGMHAPANEGATGTHEVGHWMGLYHTFQGGCEGGDEVDDTPAVAVENYGCPGEIDSCPDDGQGNDMTWNFMDYVDDACMNTFTNGQFLRAQNQWDAHRYDTPCYVNCDEGGSDYDIDHGGGAAVIVAAIVVVVLVVVTAAIIVTVAMYRRSKAGTSSAYHIAAPETTSNGHARSGTTDKNTRREIELKVGSEVVVQSPMAEL